MFPNLRIGENIQLTYRSVTNLHGFNDGIGSSNDENEITEALTTAPIIPVLDEFGGFGGDAAPRVDGFNPVARLNREKENQNLTVGIFGNLYFEFEPIENLVARTSFGGEYKSSQLLLYIPRTYEQSVNRVNFQFQQFDRYDTQWVWANTLNYEFELGQSHSFGVPLGQ